MKKRKTIEIEKVKEMANAYFSNSQDKFAESRKGVATFLANILHTTGNYQGFGYLDIESDIHAGPYGQDGRVSFY